jgi:hypothetical protein
MEISCDTHGRLSRVEVGYPESGVRIRELQEFRSYRRKRAHASPGTAKNINRILVSPKQPVLAKIGHLFTVMLWLAM